MKKSLGFHAFNWIAQTTAKTVAARRLSAFCGIRATDWSDQLPAELAKKFIYGAKKFRRRSKFIGETQRQHARPVAVAVVVPVIVPPVIPILVVVVGIQQDRLEFDADGEIIVAILRAEAE